ncbi:LicD family protein [Thiorhodovibrio winogradskyi]|nr:LicD family protein [Thiorhodovibrio winogradskyi]
MVAQFTASLTQPGVPPRQSVQQGYLLALAHARLSQFDQASIQACQALRLASRLDWPEPARTTSPVFRSDLALPLLLKTLNDLARQGYVAFATGGTLLGLVREGRLLPTDKDLDIATPLAQFAQVAQSLIEQGWQPNEVPLKLINFRSFIDPAAGITLDLVGGEYDAERNKVLGGWWPEGVPRTAGRVLQFTPYRLERKTQGRLNFWVIPEPDTLLSELFGPYWRLPDPDAVNLFETSALVEHNGFSHCLGYLRLLEAWLTGRQTRFARLTQALRRLDPDDPGLRNLPQTPLARDPVLSAQRRVQAGLQLAVDQFRENRIDSALAIARQAVQRATTLPLPATESAPIPPVDTEQGWALLQTTLVQLAAQGIQAFAFGGALLGWVREGGLLPNDKDLDIVVPWPQFDPACQQLLASGWQAASIPVNTVNFRCFVHPASQITLDLFGYDFQPEVIIGGWWPTGLPREAGRLLRFTPFELHQQQGPQGAYWAIAHPETALEQLYGPHWREPDSGFDTTLESPALEHFTGYCRCWGLLRLLEAWIQGHSGRFCRRLRIVQRRAPDEPVLDQFAEDNPCA